MSHSPESGWRSQATPILGPHSLESPHWGPRITPAFSQCLTWPQVTGTISHSCEQIICTHPKNHAAEKYRDYGIALF